jgi:hypothetical protein
MWIRGALGVSTCQIASNVILLGLVVYPTKNGKLTHTGLLVVAFTHKGVFMEVNGPGVVFIET